MEKLEQLMKEWEQFKSENDRRLKEIETKGRADPLTEEKIQKHSEAIGVLEKQLREVETKTARPGASGDDEAKAAKAEHRKGFVGYLRKGHDTGLRELEQKAMSVGSDGDGGYAVTEGLDTSIGALVRNDTPMLSLVNAIVGPATYEKLINVGGTTSAWVGETDARAETSTPTLASVKPFFGEIQASPKVTQKLLDDAMFDVEGFISENVGMEFAEEIDDAIVNGNGTNKPKGILAYTLAETADSSRTFGQVEKYTTTTTSASFTGDELITFIHKLKKGYRQNAKWVMPGLAVAIARKLKDATSGQYLWQPGLGGGQPSTLLSYEVVEDEAVPTPAGSSKSVLFGDFKRAYRFVTVRGIRVLRDPYSAKPYVTFYTTQRVGGGVEDSCAVKVLVLKA